jgi:phospholipid/cholesterol/gamma-HCH transport system substrate-binding protein
MVGLIALGLVGGAVVLTGMFLTGSITGRTEQVSARFSNCGQGLREGGDVKLRGVLVGEIGAIERADGGACDIRLDVNPEDTDQIPANIGAQIRAKTIFGEKWVELLYPDEPEKARLSDGDEIPEDRTIDPLEVETILNVALPLLDAIDPEHLAGALDALAGGFVGHEDAAIRGIEDGIRALQVMNDNEGLLKEGIRQLDESGEVFADIDDELLRALDNLDRVNRFTSSNRDLIEASLEKAPRLLNELGGLFEARFEDFTNIVNSGATVVSVLAARSEDLDRLLDVLPRFNSAWIRNLNHVCRYRQATDEPGKSVGERVPGRCWRVHNLISESQGAYGKGESPGSRSQASAPTDLEDLLKSSIAATEGSG